MHLRLICRVSDEYKRINYETNYKKELKIRDKSVEIIEGQFEKYGLKKYITTTYREESPFISARGGGENTTIMYWQEMVVCLDITDHITYNKVKLKHPELLSAFNGNPLHLGRNTNRMKLAKWK